MAIAPRNNWAPLTTSVSPKSISARRHVSPVVVGGDGAGGRGRGTDGKKQKKKTAIGQGCYTAEVIADESLLTFTPPIPANAGSHRHHRLDTTISGVVVNTLGASTCSWPVANEIAVPAMRVF